MQIKLRGKSPFSKSITEKVRILSVSLIQRPFLGNLFLTNNL
jgi:hypothetical protein